MKEERRQPVDWERAQQRRGGRSYVYIVRAPEDEDALLRALHRASLVQDAKENAGHVLATRLFSRSSIAFFCPPVLVLLTLKWYVW